MEQGSRGSRGAGGAGGAGEKERILLLLSGLITLTAMSFSEFAFKVELS